MTRTPFNFEAMTVFHNRVWILLMLLVVPFSIIACQTPVPGSDNELAVPLQATAAATTSDTTTALFEQLMTYARSENLHTRPLGEVMVAVGDWFNGMPYVAGTLDQPAFEQLVVKLDGFDCVTFVESVLAASRTIADQSYSYQKFTDVLKSQRYRDNNLDGYCSRLHYFSEWIADNEKRGQVEDITQAIGGEPLDKQLNFMSEHRDSYPRLAASDSLYEAWRVIEHSLKDLSLYYVPQRKIRETYPSMKAGDILALATDIKGLDVTHTGLAYQFPDGHFGLLHASTSKGVTVSPDLQSYVENNKRQIGIVVARPK